MRSSCSMRFHQLDRPRDPNFWAVRVNDDIRLIVHRAATSLLLCYVGHHDDAHGWAERAGSNDTRRQGRRNSSSYRSVSHQSLRQRCPKRYPLRSPSRRRGRCCSPASRTMPCSAIGPPDWLDGVRRATEDLLFEIVDHLPQEATEALLKQIRSIKAAAGHIPAA